MKTLIAAAALLWLALLMPACSGDKSKIDNARFEIEQGNAPNARKILSTIPAGSPQRRAADSLLKSLEDR